MRFWLTDTVLRRVLRNTGRMGMGKAAGAVLHLASIAVTARLLDLATFGLLMLARSLAQGLVALARCQSWQALIHFGAEHDAEGGSRRALSTLWLFLAAVDLVLGGIALVAGIALALVAGDAVGLGDGQEYLGMLYCIAIPFLVSNTPTGILRLWDRFDLIAWQSLVTPTTRLSAVVATMAIGAPIWAVVLAWVLSDIFGELFLWIVALTLARRRGLRLGAMPGLAVMRARYRGIVRYLAGTNVNASMQMGGTPLLTLVAGATLGAGAAGAFRLAQSVLEAIAVPAELAMRSLFPEVARLRTQDPAYFRQVITRIAFTAIAIGIPLAVTVAAIAPWLLHMIAGEGYGVAGTMLQILAVGIVAIFLTAILETVLLASGYATAPAFARSAALLTSVALVVPLADRFGTPGLAMAVLAGPFVSTAVLMIVSLKRRD